MSYTMEDYLSTRKMAELQEIKKIKTGSITVDPLQ